MEGVGRTERDQPGAELARSGKEKRCADLTVSVVTATADADVGSGEEVKEMKVREGE